MSDGLSMRVDPSRKLRCGAGDATFPASWVYHEHSGWRWLWPENWRADESGLIRIVRTRRRYVRHEDQVRALGEEVRDNWYRGSTFSGKVSRSLPGANRVECPKCGEVTPLY
jgi:hypothetical protein